MTELELDALDLLCRTIVLTGDPSILSEEDVLWLAGEVLRQKDEIASLKSRLFK